MATLLLDESRSLVRTQPAEAERLAALVGDVIERVPGAGKGEWAIGLAARAEAHRANALRIAGEVLEAKRLFSRIRASIATSSKFDLDSLAEVARLEAALLLDRREMARAEDRIDYALMIYREIGDVDHEAQVLIQRGMAAVYDGRPAEALTLFEEAAQRVDPARNLYLFASCVSGLIVSRCDLGDWAAAKEDFDRHSDLCERLDDPHILAVFRDLEGRIALGQRRLADAETALVASRDMFLNLGRRFDAMIVSMDLASLYEEIDKTKLRRLRSELIPLFRARGIHRDSLTTIWRRRGQVGEKTTKNGPPDP